MVIVRVDKLECRCPVFFRIMWWTTLVWLVASVFIHKINQYVGVKEILLIFHRQICTLSHDHQNNDFHVASSFSPQP